MKYLWTEDTGAGLHFWKLVNQLFFDNALVMQRKKMNITWISVYQQVKNSGFPLLSFSDNPYSEKSSKHGMWGIGASYTYLKMSQTPNLESVRQRGYYRRRCIQFIFTWNWQRRSSRISSDQRIPDRKRTEAGG